LSDFDFFVIGAGSAGVRACRIAASLGARVGVAEERYFGGTCVNVGCVPKKLFSYAAHYRDDFQDSRGFGWNPSEPGFDWHRLKENKDNEINRLNDIYETILSNNKVTIFNDRAVITGPNELSVAGARVTAKYILIAVGGWPWVPAFPGSEYAVTSNELFAMEQLPSSMVVVGGGYIAVEFASIFSRLNCDTQLIYRGPHLLRGFDDEVRRFISAELGRTLNLKLNTSVTGIEKVDEQLLVTLDQDETITTDMVLYATGRKPLTANLGLENLGIDLSDNGAIKVDENFQTSQANIFAIGDVIDRLTLTPVALAEGEVVARNLFSDGEHVMNYDNIPSAVFCHPNLASVGLTEEQAQQSHEIDIYTSEVKQLKHTLSGRQEKSFLKLVVDKVSDKVLGLHMVGPDAGEIVQGFAVALNCGATKNDFDRTIGIHPTLAEELVTMRNKRND